VTLLGEEIYLLRPKGGNQVEVYDVISYRLLHCLTVPYICGFNDMTSCKHFLCLYIGDHIAECIHRLDLQGNSTEWPVNNEPSGLSVNADHNLIVTCDRVRKIKEFSPRGDLLRDVTLQKTSSTRGMRYNWPMVSLLCVTVAVVTQSTVCVR